MFNIKPMIKNKFIYSTITIFFLFLLINLFSFITIKVVTKQNIYFRCSSIGLYAEFRCDFDWRDDISISLIPEGFTAEILLGKIRKNRDIQPHVPFKATTARDC